MRTVKKVKSRKKKPVLYKRWRNVGLHARRILDTLPATWEGKTRINRERVFAEAWERENSIRPGINYGRGCLDDLMVVESQPPHTRNVVDKLGSRRLRRAFELTDRDRTIAATLVQWLGSNMGWAWLSGVIDRCGYRVVRKKDSNAPPSLTEVERALLQAYRKQRQWDGRYGRPYSPTRHRVAEAEIEEKEGRIYASYAEAW